MADDVERIITAARLLPPDAAQIVRALVDELARYDYSRRIYDVRITHAGRWVPVVCPMSMSDPRNKTA